MKPVDTTLTIANSITVVDNVVRLAGFLRSGKQDPKVEGFYVRLLTEKARYAEWKRRMGIETYDDVERLILKLPEHAGQSLPRILAPVGKYTRVLDELFVKYGIVSPDTPTLRQSLRQKIRRADLLIDGHRQVEDILNTLKSCNDGLLTIAPPAPGYYVSLAGNKPTIEPSEEMLGSRFNVVRLGQHLQSIHSSAQTSLPPSENNNAKTVPESSTPIVSSSSLPGQASVVFHSQIELLISTCLQVLGSMEGEYPAYKTTFRDIRDRLGIWGSGLFHGQVSIDQALNNESKAIILLRTNILGTLADIATILRRILSILGEPDNSPCTLQLRELFALSEIAFLPQSILSLVKESDEAADISASIDFWCREVADLTECLFCTLSTIEMIMKETMARQMSTSAIDERDLVLIKSESNMSLPDLGPGPTNDLLKIDLRLIAAMQESLKDSKFAKYMEHRNLKFDAVQLSKDLGEESRQMKYWAGQLGNTKDSRSMTPETQTALALNLTRTARTFEAQFKSAHTDRDLYPEIDNVLEQCLKQYPEVGASPVPRSEDFDILEILKSSNLELKKLAMSKAPELRYEKDFALSEEAELVAALRAASVARAHHSRI